MGMTLRSADDRHRRAFEKAPASPHCCIQTGEGARTARLPSRGQEPFLCLSLNEHAQSVPFPHAPYRDRLHAHHMREVPKKFLLRTQQRRWHGRRSDWLFHQHHPLTAWPRRYIARRVGWRKVDVAFSLAGYFSDHCRTAARLVASLCRDQP